VLHARHRFRPKAEVSRRTERFFIVPFNIPPRPMRMSAAAALAVSALAAALVAVLRYHATGGVGATFDTP
jgi:hypothetical protein